MIFINVEIKRRKTVLYKQKELTSMILKTNKSSIYYQINQVMKLSYCWN